MPPLLLNNGSSKKMTVPAVVFSALKELSLSPMKANFIGLVDKHEKYINYLMRLKQDTLYDQTASQGCH